MEKHVRLAGGSSEDGSSEDVRDRQSENHLNACYDEVIASIREAEFIEIFGPGEAKGELGKRLAGEGLKDRIVEIGTVDKMTDRQIAAQTRQRFEK